MNRRWGDVRGKPIATRLASRVFEEGSRAALPAALRPNTLLKKTARRMTMPIRGRGLPLDPTNSVMAKKSFEIRSSSPERIVQRVERLEASRTASPGLLFLAGEAAQCADQIAETLAGRESGRWLIARVPGVLTERGEVEHESAAVGMVFSEVSTKAILHPTAGPEFGAEVAAALAERPGSSMLTLLRGDETDDGWLVTLDEELSATPASIFGAGVLPHHDLHLVGDGQMQSGGAGALVVERPWVGRVTASSACRLLSPLVEVTKTRGPMVLELGGRPALNMLSEAAQDLDDQPLVLLAIATHDRPLAPEGRQLALRALHGVDPTRGGLLVGDELPVGTKVAFAVRDAHGARTDLDAHLRTLRRSCAGTAPSFGIYVNCAGRGRSLYQSSSVDVRLIREHFSDMPLVGIHSTFELAPLDGKLTPQIYTGVLGVFCAPS